MTPITSILIQFLVKPSISNNWDSYEWHNLLQEAYLTGLVARVYWILQKQNLLGNVPEQLMWHLESANLVFSSHQQDVKLEIKGICNALKMAGITPVFLKGTAYMLANDICFHGRLFSDIDIFVPKDSLNSVEEMLKWNGWVGEKLDEHDEKYYRDWMHEIPPMTNNKTGMTIDVHHNLVPLVSRIKLSSDKLLENTIVNEDGRKTLAPEDKVLHSAAHLLLDSEFKHGFRDLHDLFLLITTNLDTDRDFIDKLHRRSNQLGFNLVLFYCLSLLQNLFGLGADKAVLKMCKGHALSSPFRHVTLLSFQKVLTPSPLRHRSSKYRLSSFLLFVRSHWLKMPVHILLPHLLYKAFVTPYLKRKENAEK